MMSDDAVDQLADGWIKDFSIDPYALKARQMEHWFALDELIHNEPGDALRVFERAAQKDMINWTLEGLGIGPLRTFLMIYGDRFDASLIAMCKRLPRFNEMYAMAMDGL